MKKDETVRNETTRTYDKRVTVDEDWRLLFIISRSFYI